MCLSKITNLLDLDAHGLIEYCAHLGEQAFRAKQLQRWIHQAGVADFDSMTDLAKSFREKLKAHATIQPPHVIRDHAAADGTRKWLIDVGAGDAVETVFIPEHARGTLCISSQAGCAVNCRFCATGKQGFNRNLSVSEIIGQLWMAEFALRKVQHLGHFSESVHKAQAQRQYKARCGQSRHPYASIEAAPPQAQIYENDKAPSRKSLKNALEVQKTRAVTNVVMMGMGEPLLNFDAVVRALRLMLDDHAYGLSRRRVTISTSGVVPMMDRLAQQLPVSLAVSLHAPDDRLRDGLVPLNKKYPLRELMRACQRYLKVAPRDFITFEYCMLAEVNDQDRHAHQLAALVQDISCKFNLIPFNPFPNSGLTRSSPERIQRFAQILNMRGIVTTIRKTRGDEIDAACGQLAGVVNDRTRLAMRSQKAAMQAGRRTIEIHPQ